MLDDGEEIGQDLSGMVLVGKPVPYGHTGILGKGLDGFVSETTELDAVKHTAKDPSGVGDGFFLAQLDVVLAQVVGMSPFIGCSYHKGATGAGGSLFKDESDVLAFHIAGADAGILEALELSRQVQEVLDFFGTKVQQSNKTSAFEIDCQIDLLLPYWGII